MRIGTVVSVIAAMTLFIACSANKSGKDTAKSMDQIQKEQGKPVKVRVMKPTLFSVYLKYPAEFRARTQTTAYAKVSDVVRTVHVKVGDRVARDQVVLTFSLDNSSYQQAKLTYENAEAAFNRIKALYADAGVSKQDYDNTVTQYELAREAYRYASELIKIKAPIDGIVTQLNVRSSSNVNPGSPLFTVSNQDGFEAFFYVSADEIDSIRTGARAIIKNKGERIDGRITEVSLIMDPEKKAFPVKAFFSGKPQTLVSGMSVDIAVEVYRNDRALVVTRNELRKSGDTWYALVKNGDAAEQRNLVLAHSQGFDFEVIDGLREGDVLLTDGAKFVSGGDKIHTVDSLVMETGE